MILTILVAISGSLNLGCFSVSQTLALSVLFCYHSLTWDAQLTRDAQLSTPEGQFPLSPPT